jgi:hypothetical protein
MASIPVAPNELDAAFGRMTWAECQLSYAIIEFVMACRNGDFDSVYETLLPNLRDRARVATTLKLMVQHGATVHYAHEQFVEAFKLSFFATNAEAIEWFERQPNMVDTDRLIPNPDPAEIFRTAIIVVEGLGMRKSEFFKHGHSSYALIVRAMESGKYELMEWLIRALPLNLPNDVFHRKDIESRVETILSFIEVLLDHGLVRAARTLMTRYTPYIALAHELPQAFVNKAINFELMEQVEEISTHSIRIKQYIPLERNSRWVQDIVVFCFCHRLNINNDDMDYEFHNLTHEKFKDNWEFIVFIAFLEYNHTWLGRCAASLIRTRGIGKELNDEIRHQFTRIPSGFAPQRFNHSDVRALKYLFETAYAGAMMTMKQLVRESDIVSKARQFNRPEVANWLQAFGEE